MVRRLLSDEHWSLIKHFFEQPAKRGRPRRNPREMLEAVLHVLRTGIAWRDLPNEFGPWQTAYDYFRKWQRSGLLADVFYHLRDRVIELGEISVEVWHVDGTVVRATRAAAGGGKKGDLRSLKITL